MLFSTLHSLFLQKLHFQLQMSTCILKKKNYLDRMMKKRKKVLHLENRNINKWLCTIDIDNSQNGYAKCLQQLLWMEELAISKCTGDKLESFCPFFISRLKYDVINDVRVLRDVEKSILIGETATFKKITSKESLLSGLRRDAQDFSFHYYLRIHMKKGDGDITDLQYLALMIQTMPEIQSRIAVRFMENADSEWSTNDYFIVSHYLRFFQKKYDCLYACYDEDIYSLEEYNNIAHAQTDISSVTNNSLGQNVVVATGYIDRTAESSYFYYIHEGKVLNYRTGATIDSYSVTVIQ